MIEVMSMKIRTGMAIVGATALGCGAAWYAYKKYNPNAKEDVKKAINTMAKKETKIVDDMM